MKANLQVNPKLTIEVEGGTHTELFESLASVTEVFSECKCQKCGSDDVNFVVRTVEVKKKPVKYYELRCKAPKCFAKFHFGVSEGGQLFPVRFKREEGAYVKDAEGKNIPLGTNGWTRWNFDTKTEE